MPEEIPASLRRALSLAEDSKYECRYCRAIKPLEEGIVITWGGHVFFALCPSCFPGRPISIEETILKDGRRGVRVGFLNRGDAPLVQVPRGAHELRTFSAAGALAKRQKRDIEP